MVNVFYFSMLCAVGGIETWLYNISKLYGKDYDINIFYRDGDEKQVERLSKYANVYKYEGQKIKCKNMFFCFNQEIANNVEAEEYYFFIHGDYKTQGLLPNVSEKITKYIAISKLVSDTYYDVTGIRAEVVYNPFVPLEIEKGLKLISATRLTREKGLNRMITLAEELNRHNIPFHWDIFTNNKKVLNIPNVEFHEPTLNIGRFIKEADYLVQLSDCEGYCYSVVEALHLKTPVIITDLPVLKEMGVDNKYGFILDFEMKNLDVEEIYKKRNKFKIDYKPIKSDFEKLLNKSKRNVKQIKVETLKAFKDLETKADRVKGDVFEVDEIRFQYLCNIRKLVTRVDD